MSLVNTMLQDLEQRRMPTAGASAISGLSGSQAVGRGKGAGNRLLWLGLSLLLLVVAFLLAERQFVPAVPVVDKRVVSMVAETVPTPQTPQKTTSVVMPPVITVVKPAPVVGVDKAPKSPPPVPIQAEQHDITPPAPIAVVASPLAPVVDVDVDAKEFATPAKMQKQVRPLDASQ
ncbi:MAG: hypothetical protein GXP17_10400, partial [Gammaproteobacteria bacterium]|nr:hypothetical protein [Gammaproteobacteria bacterium]